MTTTKLWRVEPDSKLDLDDIDTDGAEQAPGDKHETKERTAELGAEITELQGRLWAESKRSVLVVLQALDAGGKDGTVKRVFSSVNPMGVHAVSFKAPSSLELSHDFLWRIYRELPERGQIGIFNRSHYEDVLITRVNKLVSEQVWKERYDAIRNFEAHLATEGTTVLKFYLHISRDEQAERFQERLDNPAKNWKFSAADLEVRKHWVEYRKAYTDAIEATTTKDAPWFVIPADRKWCRDWAVSTILLEALQNIDPKYPAPSEDLSKIVIS